MSDNGDKVIEIPANISVRDLAERIHASPIDIIKQLMANGVMASINQQIDYDTAAIVIGEFGFEARQVAVPEPAADEQGPAGPSWRYPRIGSQPLWARKYCLPGMPAVKRRAPFTTHYRSSRRGRTSVSSRWMQRSVQASTARRPAWIFRPISPGTA